MSAFSFTFFSSTSPEYSEYKACCLSYLNENAISFIQNLPRVSFIIVYSWQPPTVCLFNLFTELPLAIYTVAPPCQSSRVQANWHSRSSIADRPICSDRYPSQEAFIPGGKGEKQLLQRCSLNQHPAGWLCLLLTAAEDWCVHIQRKKDSCNWEECSKKGDIPLQTLQHLPSGKICSVKVQLSSGQVSVTFTIRPFWKDKTKR